ncbi:hypothetical protein [Sphingobacterium thalpophilum]|uniref:hypothetical protein n=1 Tax=Sphingobacterium thalpophilum TaxID=259 RepID=UPI003C742BE5
MKILKVIFFFILISSWTYGQTTVAELLELNKQLNDTYPENYQICLQRFNKLAVDSMDERTKSLFYQMLSTYYCFIGDYEKSRSTWDDQFLKYIDKDSIEYDTSFYRMHAFVDAREYILERAAKEKVVMINEAHNIPYHRAFIFQLLKDFRKLGFTHLAVEGLSDGSINATRTVTDTTGFYIREPLFAEMIREALKQQFTLVYYEAENTNSNRMRDSLQAVNLTNVLKAHPQAKVLVYAGYDHIQEGSQTNWKKMAQFFKDLTKINPLTVSQTRHIERYHKQFETVEYGTLSKFESIRQPVVAIQNGKAWHDKFVDISVFYPRYLQSGQRPEYLTIGGIRKARTLDTQKSDEGLFVQAYYANEKKGHRVPADQLFINNEKPQLYLQPGKYVIEYKNADDVILRTQSVEVN